MPRSRRPAPRPSSREANPRPRAGIEPIGGRRRNDMAKTILITGAGSGFGEAAAIGLARNGHDVIATAQISPQVAALRAKIRTLGLANLRAEKLDLFDPYDVATAQ